MDKQPHNNLWAEKLLQVSMPDSAETWSGMEALLDKEMPRRVWSDWRRWVLLILLLLLLIGVCNCPGRGRLFHGSEIFHGANEGGGVTRDRQAPVSPATPTRPSGSATPVSSGSPATPGNPASPSGSANSGGPATPGSPATQSPVVSSTPSASAPPVSAPHTSAPTPRAPTPANPTIVASRRTHPGPIPPSPAIVKATHSFGDITETNTSGQHKKRTPHKRKPAQSPPAHATTVGNNIGTGTNEDHTVDDNTTPKTNAPATGTGKDSIAKNSPILQPQAKPAAHKDSTRKDSTRKDSTRKDSTRKDSTRKDSTHKKPPPPPKDDEQKEKDHGWVFGVGLNQFFPLGDQRGSTYNSNGLTGTLTDYLPVPMIRYYLNRKTYIQLEAQFNTPQPTEKNLVISQPKPDTATRGGVFTQTTASASIQQLYYFNIPLSIHFNPWNNLNIGTGFQWSHLSNAVGEFDSATSTYTNGNLPTVVDAKSTHSFKGDTLYQRIKTNELRFLLDVNYTYKHFVLGLRYNQALSRFVNLQLPNGETTQGRNSSLQLYLRYILWDTRKKKKTPEKTP